VAGDNRHITQDARNSDSDCNRLIPSVASPRPSGEKRAAQTSSGFRLAELILKVLVIESLHYREDLPLSVHLLECHIVGPPGSN
jgi:hypothetical protein